MVTFLDRQIVDVDIDWSDSLPYGLRKSIELIANAVQQNEVGWETTLFNWKIAYSYLAKFGKNIVLLTCQQDLGTYQIERQIICVIKEDSVEVKTLLTPLSEKGNLGIRSIGENRFGKVVVDYQEWDEGRGAGHIGRLFF